jgi:nicotinamidase-related amidase
VSAAREDRYTAPDFSSAALVTIDTQRDVLDGGALEIAGTSAALPQMRALLDGFRAARAPIVHIVRLYEPDGSNADICRRELLEEGAPILHPGADGTQLARELLPAAGQRLDDELLLSGGAQPLADAEVAIYKPRWGAFYKTTLEHLREHRVSTLVFCGCNFPNCPRTSIYEASERDFRIVLARDAISGLYERGERELEHIGVRLMGAADVLDAVRDASISRVAQSPS